VSPGDRFFASGKTARLGLLAGLLCSLPPTAGLSLDDADRADRKKALESVRSQIKAVQTNIESTENDIEQMLAEIQEYEMAAVSVADTLSEINGRMTDKKNRLSILNDEFNELDRKLKGERKRLSDQIRATYQTGRGDYIKLLLNQEDPAMIGRILAYHDYYNRARTARINRISDSLKRLQDLQNKIRTETGRLGTLQSNQISRLAEFNSYKSSRQKLLSQLQTSASERGNQLKTLQKTERELLALITNLKHKETIVDEFENTPPFSSLKGKLAWPVPGKIRIRFGDYKKGGRLKSSGVTFETGAGIDVKAISPGRVIYADWFRNLGLLLILDHGDGFMSLYGHNEALLKKRDDWVEQDESIAKTGDTGGQQYTGLYFEIRQGGNPLNPSLWCRR